MMHPPPSEHPHWPPREDLPWHPGLPEHPAKPFHPPPEADEIVFLLVYNSFHLEEGRIYRFITSDAGPAWVVGPFYYNLFNLGPGHIFYCGDANPSEHDPYSSTLPPNCADNSIFIDSGFTGLRIVANKNTDITIRLAKSIGTW